MRSKRGFTLVEILIVVVILGILAAIVIPQFTEASEEARYSSLVSDLQTVRSQIELYKIQHKDAMPGTVTGVNFEAAMTDYTDIDGAAQTAPGTGVYGPYIQKIPTNPFNNLATVEEEAVDTGLGGGNAGWHYNTVTGGFFADDDDHKLL